MTEAIIKNVIVNCTAEAAFEVFVTKISSWWPLEGYVVSARDGRAALAVTIEPIVGGAVYETMHDGTRTDWGEVLVFEPGRKLAMTWHPGNNADSPTRVEVVFEDREGGKAAVTLTHKGWEVWAEAAAERRDGYNSGWDLVLGRFVGICT